MRIIVPTFYDGAGEGRGSGAVASSSSARPRRLRQARDSFSSCCKTDPLARATSLVLALNAEPELEPLEDPVDPLPDGGRADIELPSDLARSASLFVESRVTFQAPPAGAPELKGLDPARSTELGEALAGRRPGRRSPDELTVGLPKQNLTILGLARQLAANFAREPIPA